MKTRIVHTKVWKDSWFVKLSKDAKLLWLYLLTTEKNNICGIFEITEREILFDTSIDTSMLTSIKQELEPKAMFIGDWVKIQNTQKYNNYLNSPKNIIACITELGYIPDDIKVGFGIPDDTSIDTSMYTPINNKSEIINQKSEFQNQEPEESKEEQIKRRREYVSQKLKWRLD